MHRELNLLKALTSSEIEDRLSENAIFQAWRQDNGIPDTIELKVRQLPDLVDALLV
jgi:hypothetical protein